LKFANKVNLLLEMQNSSPDPMGVAVFSGIGE
jgi:hypothetical protein